MNQPAAAVQAPPETAAVAKAEAAAPASPLRHMIDSAYPLGAPPSGGWRDIILIYAGGDTPHPWTTAEILAMPARYRFPTWVRSNPGFVAPDTEAALFAAWLHGHHVPQHTCVCLDLETAVDPPWVGEFNASMRRAGWKVTKYGSQNFIWQNPKTDGGTYVALPNHQGLSTEGDTVATQNEFDGNYDVSITLGQDKFPLWDTRPGPPRPPGPGPKPPGPGPAEPGWLQKAEGEIVVMQASLARLDALLWPQQ